ncbi:MAG TPA: hypothetical protein VLT33_13565 [Labilithrix sp.]|nr:hypothetical protein [Labilithrix sp.]
MSALRCKSVFVAFALAATLATVSDASADDKSGATGASFSALPVGTIALPPKVRAPAAIPGGEKVAGFVVVKQQRDYVTLVPNAKAAKQFESGIRDESALAGGACFVEDQPELRRADDDTERAWRGDLQTVLVMNTSFQGGQRPTVTAVHSERVAEEGGRVSLEVVDAWVDPRSRGVRLINRASVPLLQVATLLGGTRVFAARDAGSIQVVLLTPRAQRGTGQEGIFSIVDANVSHSACDHMRVAIKAEKGQGHTGSFISNVQLASLEDKDAKPPEPKPGFPAGLAGRTEARIRPMHVSASVTWPSREKEALLSVSAGWDSRERVGFVF